MRLWQLITALIFVIGLVKQHWVRADFASTLVVGGPSSYTGKHVTLSSMMRRGFEFWAAEVNASKSLIIDGSIYAVKLLFEDDGSTEGGARAAAGKILAKVDIVLAPYGSTLTLAVLPLVQATGKVMFVSAGSSKEIFSQGARVIGMLPPANMYLKNTVRRLQGRGANSVATLIDRRSTFSVESCEGALEEAKKLGVTVFANESLVDSNTGTMMQISKLRLRAPDVLIGCGHVNDAVFVANACKMLNFVPRALVLLNAATDSFFQALGEANSNELLSVAPWHRDSVKSDGIEGIISSGVLDASDTFAETFEKWYGMKPTHHAAASAAAGVVISNAFLTARSSDGASLLSAAKNLNIENSFFGALTFDESGQLSRQDLEVLQIDSNKDNIVTEETLVYPMTTWFQRELAFVNRKCEAGAVPITNGSTCVPCPAGQYRSLLMLRCIRCQQGMYSGKLGAESCSLCFDENTCPLCKLDSQFAECSANQNRSLARADFYKLPGERLNFAPCSEKDICLGSNVCKWPNRGILCGQCEPGFSNRGSGGRCDAICPDIASNVLRVLAVLAMYSVYVTIVVKIVQSRSRAIKDLTTTVVRLIMNYLQLTSTAIRFIDLDLGAVERSIKSILHIVDVSGDPTETFMDISCIFRHYNMEPVYAYAVLGNILLPCIVLVCALGTCCSRLVFRILRAFYVHYGYGEGIKFGNAKWYELWVSNCAVAIFIFHPIATKLLFKALECQDLDTLRLASQLDLECTTKHHFHHALAATFGIVVWSFGTPIAAFFVLFRYQRAGMLNEQFVRNRYGFLYNGFEPKYWYFELVYAFRKVLFMSAFTIPYVAFRSTVMICLGLVFLAIHLNCQPFDNRSFFVLDQLETRNLRAFNSALLCQLVLDTVKLLRSEEVDTTTFPASFLVSSTFRGLVFLGLMVTHFMFLELAVSTMLQEKIVKPNRLLVDHVQMVLGFTEIPAWRKWFARFNKCNTMKYDEHKQVLLFCNTTKEEREFVMLSLNDFLTTNVGNLEEFRPGMLGKALRAAVKRIYRHKASLLQQLKMNCEKREKTIAALLMQKIMDLLTPGKKKHGSPAWEEIDPDWISRFRKDGFTAEELNDMLSVMVNAAGDDEANLMNLCTKSPSPLQTTVKSILKVAEEPAGKAFGAVMDFDPKDDDSPSSSSATANQSYKMKDFSCQTYPNDLQLTIDQDLRVEFIGLVIDKFVEKVQHPKEVRNRRGNLARNPATLQNVNRSLQPLPQETDHKAIMSEVDRVAPADKETPMPSMKGGAARNNHALGLQPQLAATEKETPFNLPTVNERQVEGGLQGWLTDFVGSALGTRTPMPAAPEKESPASRSIGVRDLDENGRKDTTQTTPIPSAELPSKSIDVTVAEITSRTSSTTTSHTTASSTPFHKALSSTLVPVITNREDERGYV